MLPFTDLPRWHTSVPVCTAVWKQLPEDFVVEEIPAYEPCGEGEHLYLWIEKRGWASEDFVRHLARSLQIARDDIGIAGMKDRWAITRQWISVPAKVQPHLGDLTTDGITLLDQKLHRNKLRTGHLKGNRFTILLRNIRPCSDSTPLHDDIERILRSVRERGFLNYFGSQRFGREASTVELGWRLLRGEQSVGSIPFNKRKFLLRLALSAVQSELFNLYVARRHQDQLLEQVLAGDVLEVVESGGRFLCDDVVTDQTRFQSGEINITGPLFGVEMKQPLGDSANREAALLQEFTITTEQLANFRKAIPGGRRIVTVNAADLNWNWIPAESGSESLQLQFSLPSGSYATMLIREFCSDLQTTDEGASEVSE